MGTMCKAILQFTLKGMTAVWAGLYHYHIYARQIKNPAKISLGGA